jgi:hypothetical protein
MNIDLATQKYEAWLREQMPLIRADLALKHRMMAESAFRFFRGTFYRWAQLFPRVCPSLMDAPRPLAVGDLHVENFGTWRDSEGRLIWGVNDFDEACLTRSIWCGWPPAPIWRLPAIISISPQRSPARQFSMDMSRRSTLAASHLSWRSIIRLCGKPQSKD